jgi:predicted phosphate transport protein (TIGR00153 family)
MLDEALQQIVKGKIKDAKKYIEQLFKVEEEIDQLRTEVFKELSKGVALFADCREDILHLVKRLDTFADHVKDAARCILMLEDTPIPNELWKRTGKISSNLVECATGLRNSIENINANKEKALQGAKKVAKIEAEIDKEYLSINTLFIKYAEQTNPGALIIFNDLIKYIEYAADKCADTADYIITLASLE